MTAAAQPSWWTLVDGGGVPLATTYGETSQIERYPDAVRAVAIPRAPDPQVERWDGKAWVEDLARIEAMLIAPIKQEAERRRMLVRTPGAGKAAEYRQKAAEAHASGTLTAAVLNALTGVAAAQQFPAATMEAARTGEPLATVLARYRKRVAESDTETFRIGAIEQAAVRAIQAATTGAAKRAAAGAVDWEWRPA